MEQQPDNSWLVAKLLSVWALFGIRDWSQAAGFFASVYTILLTLHWIYIHGVKPLLIKRGLMQPETAAEKARDDKDELPL
jgi:hypothetical protein